MNALAPYSIPIKGLKNGIHLFDFQIDNTFFSNFEYSPVKEGSFNVHLHFDKKADFFVLEFDFAGTVKTECDRCLEGINLPVQDKQQLLVKVSLEKLEEEADIVYLSPDSYELNVAKYIYEFICLAIPIHRVYDCENEAVLPCNPDMLRLIQMDTSSDPGEAPDNTIWKDLREKLDEN